MTTQSNGHPHNDFWQRTIFAAPSQLIRGMAFTSLIGMSATGLIACDQKDQTPTSTETANTKEGSIEADSANSAVKVTESEQPPSIETNSAVDNQQDEGTPVSYDVNSWQADSNKRYELNDIKAIQQALGPIVSTDKNSLDYTSKAAVKYRLMQDNAPYLDVIDSQDYLEFGWYYANPTDSEAEKKASIDHAKKVYQIANNLMGEDGKKLVGNILTGQVVKNKEVGGKKVELAKCEFYSCMLILAK